jgi:hypothetical protein
MPTSDKTLGPAMSFNEAVPRGLRVLNMSDSDAVGVDVVISCRDAWGMGFPLDGIRGEKYFACTAPIRNHLYSVRGV